MRRRMRRFAGALAAVALSGTTLLAASPPAGAEGTVRKCGYYEDAVTAWYNHCTSDGSHIWVYIDRAWPYGDVERCLGPGITDIGGAREVNNAWYSGRLCNP
ncbi:DUF6355 family natural product biosynthesis protein [Streptomyces sp. CB03234]|uniref:DUF6355 family natural product biosynthesis protein n=1 Tax=Streptomyces sp. (strain CB03234) TaxID=1703937 RepID=UPI000939439D|nr:DUF6355 family natural product biosynthesis protein [Streptomyces sp. CB03234]